ncbi:MAG: dienelactone hydrolase family protein [Proteobacteria bacterium]|nr:dienelactone hydrolase family protein [Pseudomonadota bacterium]
MSHSRLFFLPLFFSFIVVFLGMCKLETLGKSDGIRGKNITFSSLTLPPASGKKPDSIVVLFHGYGDIGENFLFLGALLGQFLPDTLFVAPDGPIDCKTIPSGKQWLSASKNNRPQLLKEIKNLTPSLNRYLDDLLKTYDLPPEKMAFLGFSQGARIALHIGLRRPTCAGIVAMSGSYLDDPEAMNFSQPPILIIHGIEDKKAPVSLARESHKQLDALKMPVTLILLPGVEHDVDPQGLSIAGEFLQDCLSE